MERGLLMMKELAELSTQVQLSTEQQGSAAAQVMELVEHIAEGSRTVTLLPRTSHLRPPSRRS